MDGLHDLLITFRSGKQQRCKLDEDTWVALLDHWRAALGSTVQDGRVQQIRHTLPGGTSADLWFDITAIESIERYTPKTR